MVIKMFSSYWFTYFSIGISARSALAQGETGGADQGHDQLQGVLVVAELQLQPPLDGDVLCGGAGAAAHADATAHPVALQVGGGRTLVRMLMRMRMLVRVVVVRVVMVARRRCAVQAARGGTGSGRVGGAVGGGGGVDAAGAAAAAAATPAAAVAVGTVAWSQALRLPDAATLPESRSRS